MKQLKLTAKSDNKNADVTWADARLIGALRNISISNSDISTELFANMETLQSGKTLMLQPRFENKGENKKNLAAGVMLYRADGTPVLSKLVPISVPARGRMAQDIMVALPDTLNTPDHVKFVVWEEDSLMPVTEVITITKEAGSDADVPGDTKSDRNEAGLLGAIGDAMKVIYAGDADRYTPDSKAGFTEVFQ